MLSIFWIVVFLSTLLLSNTHAISIGIIENNIMIAMTDSSLFNITRSQCICQMIEASPSLFALNYFQENHTCKFYYEYRSSVAMKFHFNASFVFINQSITLIQSSKSTAKNTLWSFDGDLNERSGNSNGIPVNGVSFTSAGITGDGSALYLNASQNQSVLIDSTVHFNLSYQSFTIELWIYAYSLSPIDRGILGQCQSSYITNKCLHITIRNGSARMSFKSNVCDGSKILMINTWYHLTFIYDNSTGTQKIYIDGNSECNNTPSAPLQVTNLTFVPITLGFAPLAPPYYFDGLIDQLTLVKFVKNASEILNDATLMAWYRFDQYLFIDSGPNEIHGIGNEVEFENNSLLFDRIDSYFESSASVLLAINNRSYSFSIWINPLQTNNSILLHAYQINSSNDRWCFAFLRFNSQRQIQAQSQSNGGLIHVIGPPISSNVWTHIVQTYSPSNCVRLYINGSLYNSSTACDYRSSSTPIMLRLGAVLVHGNETCLNTTIDGKVYAGFMDEFRVYSRELTLTDVQKLAVR